MANTPVNNKAVNSVSDAATSQQNTLLNLIRDSDSLIVGAGYRHPFPEKVEAIALAAEKLKREKDKKFETILSQQLAALHDLRANLENDLGGIDSMGEKLGLERKEGESDEDYRKRIKDEIRAQIDAGTLIDPTGKFTDWADTQDAIEKEMAMEAKNKKSIEAAPAEEREQKVANLEGNSVVATRLSDDKDVSQVAVSEKAMRAENGMISETNVALNKSTKRSISDDFANDGFAASAEALEMTKGFNISTGLMDGDDLMAEASLMDGEALMADASLMDDGLGKTEAAAFKFS